MRSKAPRERPYSHVPLYDNEGYGSEPPQTQPLPRIRSGSRQRAGVVDLEAKSNQLSSATTGGLGDREDGAICSIGDADVDVCTLKPSFSCGKLLPSSLELCRQRPDAAHIVCEAGGVTRSSVSRRLARGRAHRRAWDGAGAQVRGVKGAAHQAAPVPRQRRQAALLGGRIPAVGVNPAV